MSPLYTIDKKIVRLCDSLATSEKCCCCTLGWGIMICNSNAVTDDDFDVVLNGQTIGQHQAREYEVKGEFWTTDSSITKDALCVEASPLYGDSELCGPVNFACRGTEERYGVSCEPCAQAGGVSDQNVDKTAFQQGNNTLQLVNTNTNYCEKEPDYECGNYGRVWVFQFCKTSDGNVELSKVLLSSSYSGGPGASMSYGFTITEKQKDDCICRPVVYKCDPDKGCTPTRDPSSKCYATMSTCQDECIKRYECLSTGCQQNDTYTTSGGYKTQTECTTVCLERFICEQFSGCQSVGYGITGDTQTQCQEKCSPQSYYCENFSGCQPLYTTTGPFKTLPDCQAVCLQRAFCHPDYGCDFMGYGTTGMLFANCATECVISSYNCDSNSGCIGRYDTSGEFSDSSACQASCLQRYTCQTNYGLYCEFTGYATTGQTQAECDADCQPKSYDCNAWNGCMPRKDTGGAFNDAGACQASCLGRYTCQSYYGGFYCDFVGYATTGKTQAECNADCQPKSYDCTPVDGCMPRADTSGAFTSMSACTAVCALTFDCIPAWGDYGCFSVSYSATPTSYNDCQQNCPPPQMRMLPITTASAPIFDDKWLEKNKVDIQQVSNKSSAYQQYFAQATMPKAARTLEEQDPNGPGTFLSKTLEKIGIKSSPTCSCKARAKIMNDKGNDWCADNITLIVGWLREEAEKRRLPFIDMAGTLLVKRAISLSRAAKKKQAKNESTTTDRTDS